MQVAARDVEVREIVQLLLDLFGAHFVLLRALVELVALGEQRLPIGFELIDLAQ